MNITIVGSGYVGLVTEACFAQVGHHATCVDNNEQKVGDADFGLVKELQRSPIIFDGRNRLRPRNACQNGLRLLRNRSLAPKHFYVMKLIFSALAALSMGAYLYGEETQTAEPAAATGQISKASPDQTLGQQLII